MSFHEVIVYTTSWCYNRKINDEKVDELYKSLQDGNYLIPFILQAVYDVKHEDSRKIRILDGQHRIKAIEKYIANETCTTTDTTNNIKLKDICGTDQCKIIYNDIYN